MLIIVVELAIARMLFKINKLDSDYVTLGLRSAEPIKIQYAKYIYNHADTEVCIYVRLLIILIKSAYTLT